MGFSDKILTKANVDPNTRTNELTDDNVSAIRAIIESEYKVEGEFWGFGRIFTVNENKSPGVNPHKVQALPFIII